jgi:maltose alpha-D-glucosyltransferase/alpha-amylase
VYHYGHTNVEAQLAQPTSLLHWVRGMLAVRRRHPALGKGSFTTLACDNESVLAFLRATDDETLLVVANLASTARAATVTLPDHAGSSLVDVFGGATFGRVGPDGTASFTLGSREFFWLSVGEAADG